MTGERHEISEGGERPRRLESSDHLGDHGADAIDAVERGDLPFELLDDLRESPVDDRSAEQERDEAWGWTSEAVGEDARDAKESAHQRGERLRRLAGRLPGVAAIGAIGGAAVAVAVGAPVVAAFVAGWGFYGGLKNAGEAVEDVLAGVETLRRTAASARSLTRRLLSRRRGP